MENQELRKMAEQIANGMAGEGLISSADRVAEYLGNCLVTEFGVAPEAGKTFYFGHVSYTLLYRQLGEGDDAIWMACETFRPNADPRLLPIKELTPASG